MLGSLLASLAGCAAASSSLSSSGAPGPPQPAPAQSVASSASAGPDLEQALVQVQAARDLDGHDVGPAAPDTEATAVVVFASWCQPCRNELAMLGELIRERPHLRVIGVNAYEEFEARSDEDRLRAFVAESAPFLQVVRADDALMAALGKPAKIPTVFLYDAQGKPVRAFLRAERAPPTKEELQAILAEMGARRGS